MVTNVYKLEILHNGEWCELDNIEYCDAHKPSFDAMQQQIEYYKGEGYIIKKTFVRKDNIQILSARHIGSRPLQLSINF